MLFSAFKKRPAKMLLISSLSLFANMAMTQNNQMYKGVVVDAGAQLVYVANPQGGVDGIDVLNGKNRWHNDQADLPLMIQSGDLIAQSDGTQQGEMVLKSINVSDGSVANSRGIAVGTDVNASVVDSLTEQFDVVTHREGLTRQTMQWQYLRKVAKGMLELDQQNQVESFGEIAFNANDTLSNASARVLSIKPSVRPVSIEGRFLDGVNGRQFRSLSQQYILSSQLKTDPSVWQKYQWTLYQSTGQFLGQIDHANAYVPFEVIGDVLMYVTLPYIRYEGNNKIESPLTLQAISLSSGQPLWSHEIRELSYQGPFPE